MPELTEAEFSKHLNTIFSFNIEGGSKFELELVELKSYAGNPGDQDGMERFSLIFKGPSQPILGQAMYPLNHSAMGAVDIFLVPIQPQADGARYEAVYNFYRQS